MTTETLIDSRAQVILVDDDPHLRQALSQTLDLAGLKVVALAEAQGLAERIEATGPAWWSATFACRASMACSCWNNCTAATANCRCC